MFVLKKILKKFKKTFYRLIGLILIVYPFFEFYLFVRLFLILASDMNILALLIVFPLLKFWNYLKYLVHVPESNAEVGFMVNNSKVISFSGPQRRGKTSFMQYVASKYKDRDKFSNLPFVINGDYTYELTKKHLSLKHAFSQHAMLLFDEASLYYHNQDRKRADLSEARYFETILQLIGHIIDGNAMMTSVSIKRMPPQLKEKIGLYVIMMGQKRFFPSYLSYICKFFGFDYSLRIWSMVQAETLELEQYNFDLASLEEKVKEKKFANFLRVVSFNWFNDFSYDDRFFKGLYDDIPVVKNRFSSKSLNRKTLYDLGYVKLMEMFFPSKTNNRKVD